jgi:hypothetical protein
MDGPRVTALDLDRYLAQIVRISSEPDNNLRIESENEFLRETDSAGFLELLKALFSDAHSFKTSASSLRMMPSNKESDSSIVQVLHKEEHQAVKVRTVGGTVRDGVQHCYESKLQS